MRNTFLVAVLGYLILGSWVNFQQRQPVPTQQPDTVKPASSSEVCGGSNGIIIGSGGGGG